MTENPGLLTPLDELWPRRPFELHVATLRLQYVLGFSIIHWQELAPYGEALEDGVLMQLGGCIIVDNGLLGSL